jgi:hypothetical protein
VMVLTRIVQILFLASMLMLVGASVQLLRHEIREYRNEQ